MIRRGWNVVICSVQIRELTKRVLHPSLQVSKDRRKYLHNEIDALNAKGLGYRLLHYSRGDGRQRTLVVKKVTQNEIGMSATPATAMSLDFPLPSRMSSACAAIPGPAGPSGPSGPNGPSGPGHKLGGRLSMDGKREASAMAAERRMSAASVRGVKKPRISQTSQGTPQASQAPQTRTSAVPVVAAPMPEEDECSSSSSDSSGTDEDEEMRKALELSLQDVPTRTNTTPQDEEKDLQEALRLSLESASSQDAPPSPALFPTLLASKSVLAAKQTWKWHLKFQFLQIWELLTDTSPNAPTSNIRIMCFPSCVEKLTTSQHLAPKHFDEHREGDVQGEAYSTLIQSYRMHPSDSAVTCLSMDVQSGSKVSRLRCMKDYQNHFLGWRFYMFSERLPVWASSSFAPPCFPKIQWQLTTWQAAA